jgi:NTP pyrophosphatase (non-canonical NTP hydrolase)
MNPKYLPTPADVRLARVIEECGEVTQAIGKGLRFGMATRFPNERHAEYRACPISALECASRVNPTCDARGPTNAEALLDEMHDLRHALDAAYNDLVKIMIEAD